jgi:hypothetical protein
MFMNDLFMMAFVHPACLQARAGETSPLNRATFRAADLQTIQKHRILHRLGHSILRCNKLPGSTGAATAR